MTAGLRRVLVCAPEPAIWGAHAGAQGWKELGFRREPDFGRARAEHGAMTRELALAGCEIHWLPQNPNLTLDAVYAHDPSLVTDHGAILLRMGKAARGEEPQAHRRFFEAIGIPVLSEISSPAAAEAGDMVWLDSNTLLVGRGYRTNAAGIEALRSLLEPLGVVVIPAPLPHGPGPDACLHLMSLLSLLDETTALVDLPWLSVEIVELLRGRGFKLVEIVAEERESLACNVLALGAGRLLALEENTRTNARLRGLGFEVRTFAGGEIGINGGGGPTCLSRPLLRG